MEKPIEQKENDRNVARTIRDQIGMRNVLAISGGRTMIIPSNDKHMGGLWLPVAHGHNVEVLLEFNDTCTVRGVFMRAGKRNVTYAVDDVYCDMVGEIAYQASCYHDNKNVKVREDLISDIRSVNQI